MRRNNNDGKLDTPVMPMTTYAIELTATTFTINGVAITFDNNKPIFNDADSYLKSATFTRSVGELIISNALAATHSASLTSFTELPLQSCKVASGLSCTQCEDGFMESTGNCGMISAYLATLPYGCKIMTSLGCSECWSPLTLDATTKNCIGKNGRVC